MNITTSLRHRDRAYRAIVSIWSIAILSKSTHRNIIEQKTKVMDSMKHCPQWIRAYVEGVNNLLFDQHFKELEFCYLVEGELYTTCKKDTGKKKVDVFYGRDDITVSDYLNSKNSNHYYMGTSKPF